MNNILTHGQLLLITTKVSYNYRITKSQNTYLDVVIVYSEKIARSASLQKPISPFPKSSRNNFYNVVYGYFLATCFKNKLKAGFATSADIVGAGKFSSFWKFEKNIWIKHNSPCSSKLIFDKFSPTTLSIKSRRKLLFSDSTVKPFNDPELFNIFFDKQKTYENLSDHAIPTIAVYGHDFNLSCENLSKLIFDKDDFSSEIIMKDRFGAGGKHIYKFRKGDFAGMKKVSQKNKNISFIIQPFAKFDQGYSFQNCPASTDIRLIYLNGKIINSYIRMAKTGDFRCNQHQGGSLVYLPISDIPDKIIIKSNQIAKSLQPNSSFFTLDFLITNSGQPYLLEGNTGPGLNWESSCHQDESQSKKLIGLVVSELAARTKNPDVSIGVKVLVKSQI